MAPDNTQRPSQQGPDPKNPLDPRNVWKMFKGGFGALFTPLEKPDYSFLNSFGKDFDKINGMMQERVAYFHALDELAKGKNFDSPEVERQYRDILDELASNIEEQAVIMKERFETIKELNPEEASKEIIPYLQEKKVEEPVIYIVTNLLQTLSILAKNQDQYIPAYLGVANNLRTLEYAGFHEESVGKVMLNVHELTAFLADREVRMVSTTMYQLLSEIHKDKGLKDLIFDKNMAFLNIIAVGAPLVFMWRMSGADGGLSLWHWLFPAVSWSGFAARIGMSKLPLVRHGVMNKTLDKLDKYIKPV